MRIRGNDTGKWVFSVDRGGTFTDVVGVDPQGEVHLAKLLSESDAYPDAALEGIARILRQAGGGAALTPDRVAEIRLGTTVATNALLERRGAPTALCITAGFEDLLEIGDQSRPDIFALAIRKPPVLYATVVGVRERIGADGEILEPLDEPRVERDLHRVRREGIRSLAVVLMHAWKNPVHEARVAELARAAGFEQVSVSHQVMPLIKIVGRGQTTLVDAYLGPVLQRYVARIRPRVPGIPLEFMKSSGGLVAVEQLRAKDTILSGPAGGVLGYAAVARTLGLAEVIGFDMGGTSTDVSRYGGELERVFETTTGGIRYQTDQLDVETVAAGGGSILWFDGRKFNVGPESAGADPGPACYGRGGPLTITDANLILGRIVPETLPRTFGPTGDRPLDVAAARRRFRTLTAQVNRTLGTHYSVPEVAEGFIRVANEIMGRAIRRISVARGYDLRRHTLICFGGAAPQHAGAIARTLGIRRIVIHPLAGVLSAYGIAVADRLERGAVAVMQPFTANLMAALPGRLGPLVRSVSDRFGPAVDRRRLRCRVFLDLRPEGSDTYLTVPVGTPTALDGLRRVRRRFLEAYQRRFGFQPAADRIEAVNLRVEMTAPGQRLEEVPATVPAEDADFVEQVRRRHRAWFGGKALPTPVIPRTSLRPGNRLPGPAIIVDDHFTAVVEPGFRAEVNPYGHLVLEETAAPEVRATVKRDPVLLEVFNHLFMSIAEQMGYTLVNTAHSVNMKERLDFSCAVFDREGNLVANAPHIPVHLGAMGESVKYILAQNGDTLRPGDMYVTNNPHHGGSHLPDVTVIAPVFAEGERVFFVATRGHHADIGGRTPGSMPPFGTSLEEEGVVIDNFLLVRGGRFREQAVRKLLSSGPYPARNLTERLSDLRAQVAANNKGVRELQTLIRDYGLPVVTAYMGYIQENAAAAMTEALGKFVRDTPVFEGRFEDFLDDGTRIAVTLRIERGDHPPDSHRLVIDFAGTDPEVPGNLNAPVAVTKAAVLYVLRTLVERDIPLNAGCLQPVEIRLPEGSLLYPSPTAAVVGGNVETSQRVVDVLYGALGVAAASQGTMNNVLFGRADGSGAQYYETVAGGAGAVAGRAGATAVQVHMTNTRITDPEVLEQRFPEVRVVRFAIRRGSGGKGRWPGGDGVERALRFQAPRLVSILSERRVYAPYGRRGGQPGAKGRNLLYRADGTVEELGGKVELTVQPGDTIVIRTPGGGGFGAP
jgi:5-oxoprolinase (ATP-hydrolysing)